MIKSGIFAWMSLAAAVLLWPVNLFACESADDAAMHQQTAVQGDPSRMVFIDPDTGERRAPTPREAAELQRSLQRTAPVAEDEVIHNPDGSTMVRLNKRSRSVLQLQIDESGARSSGHVIEAPMPDGE